MRDTFVYAECSSCGVLWLVDIPDLDRYYEHPDYVPLNAGTTSRLGVWNVLRGRCSPTQFCAGFRSTG